MSMGGGYSLMSWAGTMRWIMYSFMTFFLLPVSSHQQPPTRSWLSSGTATWCVSGGVSSGRLRLVRAVDAAFDCLLSPPPSELALDEELEEASLEDLSRDAGALRLRPIGYA